MSLTFDPYLNEWVVMINDYPGDLVIDDNESSPANYIGRWLIRRAEEHSPVLTVLYRLVYGSLP